MISNYARWILRYRWWIIAATFLSVGVLLSGARFLTFDNDYRIFFGEDNPQLVAFETIQDTYTKNDNVLIMLQPKDGKIFTRETLAAVVDFTEQAWQYPYSNRVDSISNYQHTYAEEDDMMVEDLITDPENATAEQLEAWKQVALAEPSVVNKLLSSSAHVTAVNITVQLPGTDKLNEVPEVVAFSRALLDKYRAKYPDIEFHDTGVVMLNNAFPEASEADFKVLIPLVLVVILIGVTVFLRNFASLFGSLLVILLSIMTAMGSAGWLGITLSPPSMTAPILIMTLAVADCVHFLVTYVQNLRKNMTRNDAIVESLRINIHPIFLTSVTTAIGFLSMNFSDAPPFKDLGNITAIGIMYAFVLAVTFLPALMSVLPARVKQGKSKSSVFMEKLADYVIEKRKALLPISVVIIIALVAMIPKNELNDVFVEYFDETVSFRVTTDHISENLSGMYFVDYSLDTEEKEGINNPQFLQEVSEFTDWLRQRPEVDHVFTISDTIKRLNKNMHADDEAYYRLPEQRDLTAQYLLLYEMSLPYGLDLNNQLNVSKSATRVSATLKTLSTKESLAFERESYAWLAENAPGIKAQAASPTIMFSHIGKRNIESMLTGTTVALVLISLILVFALGSIKYGLISLIPNLVPAGMAFGLWGLIVGQVGLAVSVVAAMTLGIVVDDTIHFLSKYIRARRELNLDGAEAVRYAFSTVGVALWVTTVCLVGGFMVLAQSNFAVNSSMGLLTAITISIALIVDFFFLPPLLMLLEDKRRESSEVVLQQA